MEFALRETAQKHLNLAYAEPQTQREPCTATGTADSRKEILSGNNSFATGDSGPYHSNVTAVPY